MSTQWIKARPLNFIQAFILWTRFPLQHRPRVTYRCGYSSFRMIFLVLTKWKQIKTTKGTQRPVNLINQNYYLALPATHRLYLLKSSIFCTFKLQSVIEQITFITALRAVAYWVITLSLLPQSWLCFSRYFIIFYNSPHHIFVTIWYQDIIHYC